MTSGYFLALVYNLVCSSGAQPPSPPDRASAVAAARAVVQRWEKQQRARNCTAPCKLVYALEDV